MGGGALCVPAGVWHPGRWGQESLVGHQVQTSLPPCSSLRVLARGPFARVLSIPQGLPCSLRCLLRRVWGTWSGT